MSPRTPTPRWHSSAKKNLNAAETLADEFDSLAVSSAEKALSGNLDGAIIASSTASHGDVANACVALSEEPGLRRGRVAG